MYDDPEKQEPVPESWVIAEVAAQTAVVRPPERPPLTDEERHELSSMIELDLL